MRTAITFLLIIFSPLITYSATINVPADQPTIQAGINAALSGDTVLVAAGTYVEKIDFIGKAITVQSSGGADVTVIDGNQSGCVVTFENGEGPDAVLDGFTLTNGSGKDHLSVNCGGGVYCHGSDPTITNNTITENSVGTSIKSIGGGIYCYSASPTIENNMISFNSAFDHGGISCLAGSSPDITNNTIHKNQGEYIGGGIGCRGSSPSITHNEITWNWAFHTSGGAIDCASSSVLIMHNEFIKNGSSFGNGGGINCSMNSSVIIIDNRILLNSCSTGGGGGIRCSDSTCTITHNIIHKNNADAYGGGIALLNAVPVVTNNMITNNTSYSEGGGIWCSNISSIIIENNTLSYNTGGHGAGMYLSSSNSMIVNSIFWKDSSVWDSELHLENSSTVSISHSDVEDGQDSAYVDSTSTLNWGSGMIDQNPLFVDKPNGDYHLAELSPCINRGTNDGAPVEDIDGDARPYMGTVDMGADEFTGFHPLEADSFTLSATGDIINLSLDARVSNANRNYFILGSLSGTAPGVPLPGFWFSKVTLPLTWDFFTEIVISLAASPALLNFHDVLDGMGTQTAQINTYGPIQPGMVGVKMYFAYLLYYPRFFWPYDYVSNPIVIEVVP